MSGNEDRPGEKIVPPRGGRTTRAVRWGVPLVLVLAGVVVILSGVGDRFSTAIGVALIGGAFIVAMSNALARLSLSSEDDREREERARRYFSRHGRWPNEGR